MTENVRIDFKLRGCEAAFGEKYIGIRQLGTEWLVRRRDLLTDPAGTLRTLAEQGFWPGGQAYVARLLEAARELKVYEPMDIVSNVGLNDAVIARPNGEVLVPKAVEKVAKRPGIGFYRHPSRQLRAGNLADWKREIATPLLDDEGMTFVLAAAFAPTIRGFMARTPAPFIMELITDLDRLALRKAAQSVIGSMRPNILGGDSVESVITNPGRYIAASRDSLLLLGEVETFLCAASDKKRATTLRSMLFDHLIQSGLDNANASGEPAPVAMLVENRPIVDLLGLDQAAADRLGQTLLTIRMDRKTSMRSDNRSGHAGSYLTACNEAIQKVSWCYGVALYAFQRRLVERRAKGRERLQARLDRDFRRFCKRARRTFRAERLPNHVVHPFALIYAAGRAAERLNVLPKVQGRLLTAVWNVFRRFVADRPKAPTAAAILTELAARPEVLNMDEIDETMTKCHLEAVPAFIKPLSNGKRELWVVTGQKKSTFNWPLFKRLPDYDQWFCGQGEKKRDGGKKVIGGWKNARVLRFRLP